MRYFKLKQTAYYRNIPYHRPNCCGMCLYEHHIEISYTADQHSNELLPTWCCDNCKALRVFQTRIFSNKLVITTIKRC